MATHNTRKAGNAGKSHTLAMRQARTRKYGDPLTLTRAGHVKSPTLVQSPTAVSLDKPGTVAPYVAR